MSIVCVNETGFINIISNTAKHESPSSTRGMLDNSSFHRSIVYARLIHISIELLRLERKDIHTYVSAFNVKFGNDRIFDLNINQSGNKRLEGINDLTGQYLRYLT